MPIPRQRWPKSAGGSFETEFDVLRGPVFRVVVVRIADNEVALQLVAHHIGRPDGYSFEVFVEDFAKYYEARKSGAEADPPAGAVDR